MKWHRVHSFLSQHPLVYGVLNGVLFGVLGFFFFFRGSVLAQVLQSVGLCVFWGGMQWMTASYIRDRDSRREMERGRTAEE